LKWWLKAHVQAECKRPGFRVLVEFDVLTEGWCARCIPGYALRITPFVLPGHDQEQVLCADVKTKPMDVKRTQFALRKVIPQNDIPAADKGTIGHPVAIESRALPGIGCKTQLLDHRILIRGRPGVQLGSEGVAV